MNDVRNVAAAFLDAAYVADTAWEASDRARVTVMEAALFPETPAVRALWDARWKHLLAAEDADVVMRRALITLHLACVDWVYRKGHIMV